MADDKKPTARGPIIRKKKDAEAADEAEAAKSADQTSEETPSAKATSEASEAQDEPKPAAEPEGEAPVEKKPSRRVVDMRHASATAKGGRKSQVARQDPKAKKEPDAVTQKAIEQDVSVSVDTNASMDDFAAMLDASGMGDVKRQNFSVGDQVEATVSKVGDKYVYFDLGGMDEGIGNRIDFNDDEGAVQVGVGDKVNLYVTNTRGGTIQLANKLSSTDGALDVLEAAYSTGVPVEGRVESTNKGGFEVLIDGIRCFCPMSQIEVAYTEEPDVHIGNTYRFKVTKFDEGGRNIVVSRSELQAAEQAKIAEELRESLDVGSIIKGKITRLADFGAFADIGGGVEGLIHVSELGYSRVDNPADVVSVGDEVEVAVTKIEHDDKGRLRVGLSLKETKEDPWISKIGNYVEGQQVDGTVTRLESFGAFVEIADGLEGLVHISEMSWEQHVKRPQDIVSPGDRVTVEIQSIDPMKQRISLTMKLQSGDPWANIEEKYAVGSEVTGQVENVEDFGAFIRLGGGITALLPKSEMNSEREMSPHSRFKKGDEVTARVLNIEKNRHRMALTLKSAEELAASGETGPSSYSDDSKDTGFGTLGDLLKDKLGDS